MTIQTGKQRLGSGLRDLLSSIYAYGDLLPEALRIDLRQKVRECLGAIDEPESIHATVQVGLGFSPPPPNKGSDND